MKRENLLFWIVLALLLLLVYLTVTGRLGKSRHGYAAAPATLAGRTGQPVGLA